MNTKIQPCDWISLTDVINEFEESILFDNAFYDVRPVMRDRQGTVTLCSDVTNNNTSELILYAIDDDPSTRQYRHAIQTAQDNAYTDLSIEPTALVKWLQQNDMAIPSQWHHYMTDTVETSHIDLDNYNSHINNRSQDKLTLIHDELVELTGKKRGYAQHKVLQSMRIPSKIRSDGVVIVLRHDLKASTHRRLKPKAQPNFDALG